MECELRRIVVDVPTFCERRHRPEVLWIVFNKPVVERHVDPRLPLSKTHRWIEGLRFVASYVAKDVELRRLSFSKEDLVRRNGTTRKECCGQTHDNAQCDKVFPSWVNHHKYYSTTLGGSGPVRLVVPLTDRRFGGGEKKPAT